MRSLFVYTPARLSEMCLQKVCVRSGAIYRLSA